MARPWVTLDAVPTPEGPLELRRRADDDFLIAVAGRVLMVSRASRSEEALGTLACEGLAGVTRPRVLVGGLGMGITLRAALDALPPAAEVVVAELSEAVVTWCRGPLSPLTRGAVGDPRVSVHIGDVAVAIEEAARTGGRARYHAVLLDLYEGPNEARSAAGAPHYGADALRRTRAALHPGGTFAVWSEEPDPPFEQRLTRAGFTVDRRRIGRGGRRHPVVLARRS